MTTELTNTRLAAASGRGAGADAVFDAVDEAVGAVDGSAVGVVVFPPARMDPREAATQARAASQGACVAGMSSDGVFVDDAVAGDACAAIAFGRGFAVGIGCGENARRDARGAGKAAAEGALAEVDTASGHPLLLLFVDTAAADLGEVVAGVYEVAGPRIPLAGGGANAPVGLHAAAPWLLAAEGPLTDGVVALAVVSSGPVAVAHAHGGAPLGAPMMVTRSDGRSVLRLNGAPAEREYRESLGCRAPALTDGELERLAVLHPLAQLELTGDLRLRHVHGRAADGGLLCAGAMPENAAVFVVQQTAAAVLASTRAAARAARAALPRAPRLALVFDCAARRRILGDASASTVDVAALTSEFAESPVAGLFTRGEIARQRGPFGDLNHEIVVVAFA